VDQPLIPIAALHNGPQPSAAIARWMGDLLSKLDTNMIGLAPGAPPGDVSIDTAGGYPTAVTAHFTAGLFRLGAGTQRYTQHMTAVLRLTEWNSPFATPRPPNPHESSDLDDENTPGPQPGACQLGLSAAPPGST
jgi:hypothetical protein